MMKNIFASFIGTLALILAVSALSSQQLSAQKTTFSFPFFETFTSCSGEEVTMTGTFELNMTQPSGNSGASTINVHGKIHADATGSFGNSYRLNQTDMLVVTFTDEKSIGTSRVSSVLVSKGSAPNIKLQIVNHVTTNANGDLVVEVYQIRETCK